MDLKTPISDAGIAYKMYARRLAKLGINTLEDLIFYPPWRFEDYSIISKIENLQEGETVTIKGEVIGTKNIYTRSRFTIQNATISDGTGEITCHWFNQAFILKNIKKGFFVSLSGKVETFSHKKAFAVKEYEILDEKDQETVHTGRLIPIYPETKRLSSRWLRNRISNLIKTYGNIKEYIPDSIRESHQLIGLNEAIDQLHFPKSIDLSELARERLSFDELFLTQLGSLIKKEDWSLEKKSVPLTVKPYEKKIQEFWKDLPFQLTTAQIKAVDEIFTDLNCDKPMNRLLEGDVGSGKTVVAAIAMYLSFLNGYQSTLMAPTEILANQHFKTIKELLDKFRVKVSLFTSSSKTKDKSFDIAIGTHALLNKKVKFKKLGLVVIDEQQRFGVEQRSILREKGLHPHFLTMTATPIPRTIFLTLYGNLDLSYLDEMPKGRKKIKTWLVPKVKRGAAYEWIKKRIKESEKDREQVFVVCPFIEESETMTTIKAAKKEYESLTKIFKGFKLGLLHGKLKANEKQEVLNKFREKKIDILVSTPVVEVGIDIPSATIMVIEGADRFGLAQLHQLRGRVGRGKKESYCLLFSESNNHKSIARLKYLERVHMGAELAELDLRLRGPGEIYGTKQHGEGMLKIASLSNFPLIEKTRLEAEKIFPKIEAYPLLHEKVKSIIIQKSAPD